MPLNGFFLDAVAKGQRHHASMLDTRRRTDLAENEAAFNQRKILRQDAENSINKTYGLAISALQEAKKSGTPIPQIKSGMEGFIKEMEDLARLSGTNVDARVSQLNTLIETPYVSEEQRQQDALAQGVKQKWGIVESLVRDGRSREEAIISVFGDKTGKAMIEAIRSGQLGQQGPYGDIGQRPLTQGGRDPLVDQIAGQQTTTQDFEQETGLTPDVFPAERGENLEAQVQQRQLQEAKTDLVPVPELGVALPRDITPSEFVHKFLGKQPQPLSKSATTTIAKMVKTLNGKKALINEFNIIEPIVRAARTGVVTKAIVDSGLGNLVKQATGIDITGQQGLLETLLTQQSALALRLRNPESGFGLTGNTSERDLAFLLNAVPGLGKTPEGNLAALIIMRAKIRRDALNDELALNYARANDFSGPTSEEANGFLKTQSLLMADEKELIMSLVSNAKRRGVYKDVPEWLKQAPDDVAEREIAKWKSFDSYKDITKGPRTITGVRKE